VLLSIEQAKPRSGRGISVLVADDSIHNRMLLQAYLASAKYQVDVVENGAEAVEKIQSRHYDVVFMDMQMPIMDGYMATRSIRNWEREHDAPPTSIVALTAAAMDDDLVKTRAAGCDAHVAKPVKKAILLEVIRKYAAQPARANGIVTANG
jgi:CheY-like chemotaxis protein